MNIKIIKSSIMTSVLALSFALVPVVAYAEDSGSGSSGSNTSSPGSDVGLSSGGSTSGGASSGETLPPSGVNFKFNHALAVRQEVLLKHDMTVAEHGEGKGILSGTDLTKCDVRAAKVNAIMARIVERGTNQTNLFTTIASRVEAFYTNKNLSLSNYDQLVAAVNDAATKAQTDLSSLQSQDQFKCDSANPKGQISAFRSALQTEIQDLKSLKTAVVNLIVGVKSVAGTTSSSTSTDTSTGTGGTQ